MTGIMAVAIAVQSEPVSLLMKVSSERHALVPFARLPLHVVDSVAYHLCGDDHVYARQRAEDEALNHKQRDNDRRVAIEFHADEEGGRTDECLENSCANDYLLRRPSSLERAGGDKSKIRK